MTSDIAPINLQLVEPNEKQDEEELQEETIVNVEVYIVN